MTEQVLNAEQQAQPAELDYAALVVFIRDRFKNGPLDTRKLFKVQVDTPLYHQYIDALADHEKASHMCNSCRHFLQSYGSLAYINKDGTLESALWAPADELGGYADVITTLRNAVESGVVESIFFTDEAQCGKFNPDVTKKGTFTHFHFTAPVVAIRDKAYSAIAEYRELRGLLMRSIPQFTLSVLEQAQHMLKYDDKVKKASDSFIAYLDSYVEFRKTYATLSGNARTNYSWYTAAHAPLGAVRIANTPLGVYLTDLPSRGHDAAIRAFNTMTDSLNYQRPTAELSEGNIDVAEKLIVELGLTTSINRRAATPEDVGEWVWEHPPIVEKQTESTGGVFGKLRAQVVEQHEVEIPVRQMPWKEFLETVVPTAKEIKYLVPTVISGVTRLLTEQVEGDTPILAWDKPDNRNPVSHTVYIKALRASEIGLKHGDAVKVRGITRLPYEWSNYSLAGVAGGHLIVLEGAVAPDQLGNDLFPVVVRSELHPVRHVIEKFRNSAVVPVGETQVVGVLLNTDFDVESGVAAVFLVETPTGKVRIGITRWK